MEELEEEKSWMDFIYIVNIVESAQGEKNIFSGPILSNRLHPKLSCLEMHFY